MRFLSYNHIGIVFKPCLSYIYFFSFKHILNHASRQVRHRSGGLPMNTVILFVPQQEAWIVERFGKYQRVLQPVCIIVLDKLSIRIPNSQIAKHVSEQIVTFLK